MKDKGKMHVGPAWVPLRFVTIASAWLAGAGIVFMIATTCLDVLLRQFGASVPGAYDLVRLACGVTVATSLPLTTAVKGHVAIEYFFHRLGRTGRIVVDSIMRTFQVAGFSLAAVAFARNGSTLLRSGEVTDTLKIPFFWLPWLVSAMCVVTAAISFFHLVRPGKELVKP